jgi:hypothetical protein
LSNKPTECAQKRNAKVLCVMRNPKNQSRLKKQSRRLLQKHLMTDLTRSRPSRKLLQKRLLQKKQLLRKMLQRNLEPKQLRPMLQ